MMTTKVLIQYGCGSLLLPYNVEHPTTASVDDILDIVWSGMNRGSRKEFSFIESMAARSMCVGDFITVCRGSDETHFQVASCGFKEVSRESMSNFLSETKTAISQGKPPFSALCDAVWNRQKVDA